MNRRIRAKMSKVTKNYEELARTLGLWADGDVIYGERSGYKLMIYAANSRYPYMLTVCLSAKPQDGIYLSNEEKKRFAKSCKPVGVLNQTGSSITMAITNQVNQNKLRENVRAALDGLFALLQNKGYVACCQVCNEQKPVVGNIVGGKYMHVCAECSAKMRQGLAVASEQKVQKKENIVGGIVGAFIGSLVGVLAIVLFSRLGFVAAISGVIMAVCAIKGYEMLGGKLTMKGVVICIIMALVMTYIGDRIDWAIAIVRELGNDLDIDYFTAFQIVPDFLKEGIIESGTYWYNLILLYVFTIGGAIPTIISTFKNDRNAAVVKQIGNFDNVTGI